MTGENREYRFSIGHFRVPLCLCLKASLKCEAILMKMTSICMKWRNYTQNSFSCERLCTWTRFENRRTRELVMAFSLCSWNETINIRTRSFTFLFDWELRSLENQQKMWKEKLYMKLFALNWPKGICKPTKTRLKKVCTGSWYEILHSLIG